jgi:hypothetical protein
LRHLEVAPKDRRPATIRRNDDGSYTVTLGKVKQTEHADLVNKLAGLFTSASEHVRLGSHIQTQAQYDGKGETVTLQLDAAQFNEFIHGLKEEDVYQLKHPAEFPTRP